MGIYNKLAEDINEVDIIIAGGTSLPISYPPFSTSQMMHQKNDQTSIGSIY
jgi:hypothetical protein